MSGIVLEGTLWLVWQDESALVLIRGWFTGKVFGLPLNHFIEAFFLPEEKNL